MTKKIVSLALIAILTMALFLPGASAMSTPSGEIALSRCITRRQNAPGSDVPANLHDTPTIAIEHFSTGQNSSKILVRCQ